MTATTSAAVGRVAVGETAHAPTGDLLRRRAADAAPYVLTVGLVLTCFSGQWDHIGVPGPVDRALLFGGLGLALYGRAASFARLRLRPVHLLGLAVIVFWAGSAVVAGTADGEGLFAGIDRLAMPIVFFTVAPVLFDDERTRRFLARSFVVLALYLAVVSIGQQSGLTWMVWPKYILDPSVGIHLDRARGPYVEAVANGMVLSAGLAFAGLTAACDGDRRWRRMAASALPLMVVAIVLTLTRAVWIGAVLAAVAVAVAVPRLRRWLLPGAAAVVVGILVLLAAVPSFASAAADRGGDEMSTWDRLNTDDAALRMIEANPLTGVGWYRSRPRMAEYVRQGATYPVTHASGSIEIHNVFLGRLAEFGLVGGSLWIALWFAAVVRPLLSRPTDPALHRWRVVLLFVVVTWLVAAMFGPVSYLQPNYLPWLLGGLMCSDALAARPGTPRGGIPWTPTPCRSPSSSRPTTGPS